MPETTQYKAPVQNGSSYILDYWNIEGPLHFKGTSVSSISPATPVNVDLLKRDTTPYDPSRHSIAYGVYAPILVDNGGQGVASAIAVLPPLEAKPHHSFPPDIKKQLEMLRDTSGDEDLLYATADAIAVWLPEGTEEHQTALGAYLTELSSLKIRILLSAFADAEVKLTSTSLLRAVREYLYIQNKRCAQAAAGCLLVCGGAFGRILLQEALQNPTMIPHARLIQGIFGLLG